MPWGLCTLCVLGRVFRPCWWPCLWCGLSVCLVLLFGFSSSVACVACVARLLLYCRPSFSLIVASDDDGLRPVGWGDPVLSPRFAAHVLRRPGSHPAGPLRPAVLSHPGPLMTALCRHRQHLEVGLRGGRSSFESTSVGRVVSRRISGCAGLPPPPQAVRYQSHSKGEQGRRRPRTVMMRASCSCSTLPARTLAPDWRQAPLAAAGDCEDAPSAQRCRRSRPAAELPSPKPPGGRRRRFPPPRTFVPRTRPSGAP